MTRNFGHNHRRDFIREQNGSSCMANTVKPDFLHPLLFNQLHKPLAVCLPTLNVLTILHFECYPLEKFIFSGVFLPEAPAIKKVGPCREIKAKSVHCAVPVGL